MQIRGRHEWGAVPPGRPLTPLNPAKVTDVFIHHTTGAQQPEIQPWLRAIQRFHQETRGWNDIGYSYIVDRNGTVWEGRGQNVGAHTKGYNSRAIGVAYLGDGDGELSEAAQRSFVALRDWLAGRYPIRTVRCHGDVGKTACPGVWLTGWVKAGMPLPEPVSPVPDLRRGWLRRLAKFR